MDGWVASRRDGRSRDGDGDGDGDGDDGDEDEMGGMETMGQVSAGCVE